MMKNLGINLLILAFSLIVSFVLAEVVLRKFVTNGPLAWNLNRDTSERFESFKVQQKTNNDIVVFAVGDSFTDFQEYTGENYLGFMAKEAQENGKDVKILNLGQAGTGIKEYKAVIEKYIEKVNPRLVTVGLYVGNDLIDYALANFYSDKTLHVVEDGISTVSRIKRYLKESLLLVSFSYRILKRYCLLFRSGFYERNVERLRDIYGVSPAETQRNENLANGNLISLAKSDTINPWIAAWAVVQPNFFLDYFYPKGNRKGYLTEQDFQKFQDDILWVNKVGKRAGANVVFLLIPHPVQVSTKYYSFFSQLGFMIPPYLSTERSVLMDRIIQIMIRNGLNHVNYEDLMRQVEGNLYLTNDEHWNTDGHKVAGHLLFDQLIQRGMLDYR